MVSKIHPAINDVHPTSKPPELKLSNGGSCLETFKLQVKLKRAKSAENLPFRDKNQLNLKQCVASRSMNSKNRKQDYN